MKRPIVITLLTVALLLVLAGIGAVAYFAINNGGFAFANANFVSAKAEETKTLKVGAPANLNVQNGAGNVTVVGADVEEVTVKVVKTGFGVTQAGAEEALKSITYKVEQKGDVITLTFERPKFNTRVNQTVDFEVTVPTRTKVKVNAELGKTSISGIEGNVEIINNFGDVAVEKIDGRLDVETESGRVDLVSIKAGGADVNVESGFGSINVEQVGGAKVSITSKSGAIKLENVRASKEMTVSSDFGNITFETGAAAGLVLKTNSGKIEMTSVNISGALQITNDFGDIDLEKVTAKSYDMKTNSGAITADGAQGSLKAHTGFGNITIKNAKDAVLNLSTQSGTIDFAGSLGEGQHSIHSDFGEIELALPVDSALNVNLSTEFGKITSDIPITVTLSGDLGKGSQTGTMNGGGGELKVSTKNGNITIKALSK